MSDFQGVTDMNVKYINPFLKSFSEIMPLLGFSNVDKKDITIVNSIKSSNLTISLGVIGDVKGNVVYTMSLESGKGIASKMMMGMPVNELDEMAQSALSELSNMLTAKAATIFSEQGLNVDISTPTLIYGQEVNIKLNIPNLLKVELEADNIPLTVHIGIENYK